MGDSLSYFDNLLVGFIMPGFESIKYFLQMIQNQAWKSG